MPAACSTPMRWASAGSSFAASRRCARSSGNAASESSAKRRIWRTSVAGMISGMIGVSQPAAATRSRSRR